jgi:hypothetical protein
MATSKVTFTHRIGRLIDRERILLLRAFDELVPRIPARSAAEVDRVAVYSPSPPGGWTPAQIMTFPDTCLLIDALVGARLASGTGGPGSSLPERERHTFWLAGAGAQREAVAVFAG